MDALDLVSFKIQNNGASLNQSQDYLIWLNTTCLKLADLLVNNQTKNDLRSEIVERVFIKNARSIESHLINKDEFISRIADQFNTNNPEQRIFSLKLI